MSTAQRHPFWEKAAPTLRVAGSILVAAGTIHLYAERVVFDAPTFGARAALSLGDPRVAGYAAERIADEAIAQRRDLMAYRPLLVGAARAIVSSEPFRAGFRRAAQGAHVALFSQSAERIALSVPDLGVFVRSALAHDPALAGRVPASLRGGLAVQPTGRLANTLVRVARLGHRFRRNALLAIGSGTLLLLLGIALPRDRRRALLHGGAALATAALVLFFLPPLARTALTASMTHAELRPVVAGVWDAFAGGLRLWALVLAGVGVVLASAASSFASHVEVEEVGRRVWQRLQKPARTWPGEIVRAALLTGFGLLAALRPTATLQGLTVVAGALLAFEGLRELFLLVPPRLHEVARQAEEAREKAGVSEGARTWLHYALVGFLVLGFIGAAIYFVRSPDALPRTPALTDACNGDRALCDRRLDAVVFPGAHNSMSAAEFPGWMFPNQELGSVSLLGHGIRALLFDVHYGTPIGDRVKTDIQDEQASRAKFEKAIGKEAVDAAMRIRDRLTGAPTGPRAPYLCHGFCELGALPLTTMLEGVRDFLVENPGEVLVFVIEDYVTPADVEAAFRASGLERFVYRGGVTPPFPTLRELIDSDQRLVVFGENDARGVPWYHPAFETFQETPYTFHTPGEFSCRPNRGGTAGPLFQLNHWIETTPTPKPSNAAIVNAHDFLLTRARQCQRERGQVPNILAVDFAMTGDVVGVAAEMNGLSSPGAPSASGDGGSAVAVPPEAKTP
jgi:preprotein translocase subunit Sss1